jgi:asparagine synthase (glutamine-hydrolysing)
MIQYRGPDSKGFHIDNDKGVFIAHNRLSIIDPTINSHQPMRVNDSIIAFNGEIYNYKEVKNKLEKNGVKFKSDGDTETLLQAWNYYRQNTFDLIDGMYAFVIHENDETIIAVDPFGEKTLYYSETHEGLYVCSELRVLVEILNLKPNPTEFQLTEYYMLGYFPLPDTAYVEVKRIPPGSYFSYNNKAGLKETKYWSPPNYACGTGIIQPLSERDIDVIVEQLINSISIRLTSDVPLSLFLSGGIDSSLIAAICKLELGVDIHCTTINFSPKNLDTDSCMAKEVSLFLGLEHEIVDYIENRNVDSYTDLLDIFGQPNDSITTLAVRQMTESINKETKVGIIGQGGDEIFSGYGKHYHFYKYRMFYQLPSIIKRSIKKTIGYTGMENKYTALISDILSAHEKEKYPAYRNSSALNLLRNLPYYNEVLEKHYISETPGDYGSSLQNYIVKQEMPNNRLLAMDLGGMRSSVELRTPFLSRSLVETISCFDNRALVAYGQKSILRRALDRYLPKNITDAPKKGFMYPADRLLKGNVFDSEVLSSRLGFNEAEVRKVFGNISKGEGWKKMAIRINLMNRFL